MLLSRFLPENPRVPFMRFRAFGYMVSVFGIVASILLVAFQGLNFGIDFRGGILMEVGTPGPADLAAKRQLLGGLDLGDVQLQEFGDENTVLIRVQRQVGAEEEQQVAVQAVRAALDAEYGEELSYRRVEFVGPRISQELLEAGIWAVTLSLLAIMVYIWFRFEWQFGIGAVLALFHDVALTLGVFALLQLEFNLATIAAILTIVGYSLNDTVVIYDRVRENLRRYKSSALIEIIDRSLNDTLARTIVTSGTTLLALLALYTFGGPVIQGFVFAMMWGVIVGTYSTWFLASPVLLQLGLRRPPTEAEGIAGRAAQEAD
jgi:preprotein translocase subunit SecF